MRLSDMYRMIDQPTIEIIEAKTNDLYLLRAYLETIREKAPALDLRARASSLLVTQDNLEIKSSLLLSSWKQSEIIGDGRVDSNLIEESIFLISRIKIHEDNVDSLKSETGKLDKANGNLVSVVKEYGPKNLGISPFLWYIILGAGGWLIAKKLLK